MVAPLIEQQCPSAIGDATRRVPTRGPSLFSAIAATSKRRPLKCHPCLHRIAIPLPPGVCTQSRWHVIAVHHEPVQHQGKIHIGDRPGTKQVLATVGKQGFRRLEQLGGGSMMLRPPASASRRKDPPCLQKVAARCSAKIATWAKVSCFAVNFAPTPWINNSS